MYCCLQFVVVYFNFVLSAFIWENTIVCGVMEDTEKLYFRSDCEGVHSFSTKKRKKHGRMSEVKKKLNLMSHVAGENCNCSMKCFDIVPESSRNGI